MFPDSCREANAFWGELLGLLALHLLLSGVNIISPMLSGEVNVYLDCLGAFQAIRNLLGFGIPSRSKCMDILKMIMTC